MIHNDDYLIEREYRLIKNCVLYAANDPAGVPGHNLQIIVAKLTRWLANGGCPNGMLDALQNIVSDTTPDTLP